MISFLQGKLHSKRPPFLLIDINGVGYECQAPMSTFYSLPDEGQTVFIYTHLSIREDAHVLYGFYNEQERALFRSLIKINSVGPKLALAILSSIEPRAFVNCIHEQNISALTHIPGVGKKTAERLIVEMRDRLEDWNYQPVALENLSQKEKQHHWIQDALSALLILGYKQAEASRLVTMVKENYNSVEELIRLALQHTITDKGG